LLHTFVGLTIQQGQKCLRELHLEAELQRRDTPSSSHYIFRSDGSIVGFFGPKFYTFGTDSAGAGTASSRTSNGRCSATSSVVDELSMESSNARFNVHTPRQTLRRLLLDRVNPHNVLWRRKLVRFIEDDSGVTLEFADGSTQHARLLVGADGIYSTVRAQLRPNEPFVFLNVLVILGICESSEFELVRRRVLQTVDGTTRIFVMPFTERGPYSDADRVMWQLSFPCDEHVAKTLAANPTLLRAEALLRCGLWHEPIPSLIRNTPVSLISGTPGLLAAIDRQLSPIVSWRSLASLKCA
jgi:2-polyprenyl-6-methoxyphenol hydroxylase-like FAD-dependent oxidoreductase